MVIMITNEKIKCYNCGEEITREEGYEYKDGYLCESCYYKDFIICEDCGALIPAESAKVVNPHLETKKYVCPDCAANYQKCSHCQSLISDAEIWGSDSDTVICYNCSSNYVQCEECNRIVHVDESYYSDANDCDYCRECYEELDSSYIEEYSCKPTPEFLGESEECLYLGVELEVDYGNNLKSTTKRIYDNFPNVYMKHDGSLSGKGFEIVSFPATLEYHSKELPWEQQKKKEI